ncbi:amidohydrolase family protein, partial [Methanospirillum hungatei]|uniref:amidohydrolase family protein n=1 Tax=Methanospirillum hungatei TaxID=2203 RepID=UPI0026EB8607
MCRFPFRMGLLLITVLILIPCPISAESLIHNLDEESKLFFNGTIYTEGSTSVDSLLVKNGVVQALGIDPADVTDANRIDLNGTFVYPGFHDSHVHLVEAGYGFSSGCFLYGATNADAICKIVKPIADSLPPGEPMFGGGFSLENYDNWSLEDRNKLDQVTGDRPVFLGDQLGHNAVVNSATLKLANITGQTNPPPGGVIINEDGEPTGMLRESAMTLVGNVLFDMFPDTMIEAVSKQFLDTWASYGYTSINDLSGFSGGRMLKPDMLRKMEEEGNLSIRVNYLYTLFSLNEMDDALQYLGNDTPMVRFIGLKIFVDGAYAGGQA